ncbi:hypothetical protein [Bdellovibrio sp.]|uniref:hypothetical protein n=1 Tax=Bdellovibrio sp. TaxID=28201 RepID=UPI0039E653F1
MKNAENKPSTSVISLKLTLLAMILTALGCNPSSRNPNEQKTEPITPQLSYRYCTSKDLIDLPEENKKLWASIADEDFGDWLYQYIYGPNLPEGWKAVNASSLSIAAKKMNAAMKIGENCRVFHDCVVKDNEEAPNKEDRSQICEHGHDVISGYVAGLWVSYYPDDRYNIKEICKNTEATRRSDSIEKVITMGIATVDSLPDEEHKKSFRSDLKILCGHYKETDYCSLNNPDIVKLCETTFK